MSYVDVHLHLLPGIDDGPPDEPSAVAFARHLAASGVREATVTPHVAHARFAVDPAEIAPRTAALQARLDAEGVALRLRPGGELHPAGAAELGADELELVAQGPPGARWVLLEAPFGGIGRRFLEACAAVRSHGFALVIAHPERSAGVLDGGVARLEAELAAGAVLQVSVDSLVGRQGRGAREAGRHLVRSGLAYVVASDAHGGARSDTLADGAAALRAAGVSALRTWQLTRANPAFLLRHGLPSAAPPPVPA